MANLLDLFAEVGANLIGDDAIATFKVENTSTGNVLDLRAAGASAVILNAVASGATVSVLGLSGLNLGYVSTNSTASISYALRVKVGSSAEGYWIPVYLGAA